VGEGCEQLFGYVAFSLCLDYFPSRWSYRIGSKTTDLFSTSADPLRNQPFLADQDRPIDHIYVGERNED
jgi:hypothetical protein